jgi:hypothetical protein
MVGSSTRPSWGASRMIPVLSTAASGRGVPCVLQDGAAPRATTTSAFSAIPAVQAGYPTVAYERGLEIRAGDTGVSQIP